MNRTSVVVRAACSTSAQEALPGDACSQTADRLLFLSDDRPHTAALLADAGDVGLRVVVEAFGEPPVSGLDLRQVRAVASDVSFSAAEKVDWIRALLAQREVGRRPFFCLIREDAARNRLQANSLGATRTIPPEGAANVLRRALLALLKGPYRASALGRAGEAFAAIFDAGRAGDAILPSAVAGCSQFIEKALADIGVAAMIELIWRFDDATHQHCMLVAALAGAFASDLGFRSRDVERLVGAALIHDVGKSRIPLEILNKPGRLTTQERTIVETHPAQGVEMLQGLGHSDEAPAGVRSHHEMLDGSGYPDGLSGSQIPDLVRLVTICDIFAALIERRPYKQPMTGDEAIRILDGMSRRLDGHLLRAFRPVARAVTKTPVASVA